MIRLASLKVVASDPALEGFIVTGCSDFLPTRRECTGIPVQLRLNIDGRNFVPQKLDKKENRYEWIYYWDLVRALRMPSMGGYLSGMNTFFPFC